MNRQRLAALIRKEFAQILRDPSTMAIAFAMPLVLLFLFGYGVSLDARNVGIAVVMPEVTEAAQSFAGSFQRNDYFEPTFLHQVQLADEALRIGKIHGYVILHDRFDELVSSDSKEAPLEIVVDGSDANTGRLIFGYVQQLWSQWMALRDIQGVQLPERELMLASRIWFNPEVRSENFLVPGLMAIIMTLTGSLLTSLLVAREYDRGTIETLFITPATRGEILIAKVVPTFILGMGSLAFSVAMAVGLFDVPLRGSATAVFAAGALFLLAALGMGIFISTTTKSQFIAGQLAIMITFLPAFILSDFIFNIASMPDWVQVLTYLVAARYFIAILKTLFLAGNIWSIILPNAAALLAMAAVFLLLSYLFTRKRLE